LEILHRAAPYRNVPVTFTLDRMYVRLVVGGDAEGHRHLTGLVAEAKGLLKSGALSANEEALLEEHYAWLNAHLPVPPYRTSDWPRTAAAWFKDTAREPIRRLWAIGAMLQDHGLLIRMLRSQNPGKIYYEDEF
jgi:hypothetical protein